jgi:hypothetical protein
MYRVITLRSKGGNKMKKSVLCLMTLAIIMSISISQGKTLDEYMKEAEQ